VGRHDVRREARRGEGLSQGLRQDLLDVDHRSSFG
jgi:hypothetical protein